MYPVLEDLLLAQRNSEGAFTIDDLLLMSTVCGVGLDLVPLLGDVTEEQLVSLLLKLSTIGVRLGKPLVGRLLPIPGLKAGDMTNFTSEYLTNTRVMAA